jgi:ribose transport system substrate-binding protein
MKQSRLLTVVAVAAALSLSACGNDIKSADVAVASSAPESSAAAPASSAAAPASSAAPSAAAVVAEWNVGGKTTIAEPAADSGAGKKIAYIGFGKDNPWSEYMFKGIEDEAAKYGATATFVGPPTFDAQAQFQLVSDIATAKNYDVIMIAADDGPSVAPAVKQAIDAGIQVVGLNMALGANATSADIQIPGVTSQVLENLQMNAETMADGVIQACEGISPCKVDVLWGARALAFDKIKPDFFNAKLKDYPDIKVVCETDAFYTQDMGRTQAADCLQAHPDLNVIASQADESTRGAEKAITAAGKTFGLGAGDIKLTGSYASQYGVQQVRDGKWLMTVNNRPESVGRTGVRLALLASSGQTVPTVVWQEDLDGAPQELDKAALDANPGLKGQWQG